MMNRRALAQQRIGIQIEERQERKRLLSGRRHSRALICASALFGGFWGTVAQAQTCGDLFATGGAPTDLSEVDTSVNPFTFSVLGTADVAHNALAVDPATGTLYAMERANGTLLQIDVDGSATDLGAVDNLPNPDPQNSWNIGMFADDGLMYITKLPNSTVPYDALQGIDVGASSPTAIQLDLSQPVDAIALGWFDGLFYGVSVSTGDLISVDINSGAVTTIGATGLSSGVEQLSASNGVFGITNGGEFFQFDTTTGEATLISNWQVPPALNDLAHCLAAPFQFEVDLAVTKNDGSETYDPGTDVVYEIVVTNNGPFGVQNASVSDPLPDGISTASWTCTGSGDGVCGADSGSGAITDTPNLPVGASVTYAYTVTVPEDKTGDLVNTVTVELPDTAIDPMPGDNSATDTDTSGTEPVPALPPLAFVLLVTLLATATLWILRRAHA